MQQKNKNRSYGLLILLAFMTGACSSSDDTFEGVAAQKENPPVDEASQNYIVVLKKGAFPVTPLMSRGGVNGLQAKKIAVHGQLQSLSSRYSLVPAQKTFSVVISGGVYKLTTEQAQLLSTDPKVAYVERDQTIRVSAIQNNATWGLDRLDQANLPLNQTYNFLTPVRQVNAYVIDTGILTTHSDFQGRAVHGVDTVDNDSDATDCNGHGTHVAGTIGSLTYGVAKNVKLIGVRVLDCAGSGQYSDVIEGIEWVTANHVKPAVANMSLGGPVSQAVDDAINASVQAGVTYVVAAGNSNALACNSSPSRVPDAITVGSSTSTDARSSFSNYGSCVDVFAPGTDIKSTWFNSNSATNTISGTSMASPHVAGVAALYLAQNPGATPSVVASALVAGSLSGKVSNAGSGSPNKLINVQFLGDGGGGDDGGDGGDGNDGDDDGGDGDDGDDGDDDVDGSVLKNGETLSGFSGAKGDEKYFTIVVPTGATKLSLNVFGGTGDVDIYVRFGEKPTLTQYDCRPYLSGNTENCVIQSPKAGVWHVLLRAYSNFSGASLKSLYEFALVGAPCSDCVAYSGSFAAKGEFAYHPNGTSYSHAGGTQQVWLRGPDSADFDLFLYKWDGSRWAQVASSTKTKSEEQINYSGAAGNYLLKVLSYSGSGSYKLWKK